MKKVLLIAGSLPLIFITIALGALVIALLFVKDPNKDSINKEMEDKKFYCSYRN